jgi:hypothetical protein
MYNTELNEHFKLPIEYLDDKYKLSDDIIKDLELIKTHDNKSKPLYHELFSPKSDFSNDTVILWSKYYTDDVEFLNESKKLYTNIKLENIYNCDPFYKYWLEIQNNKDFLTKYHYIDGKYFRSFNNNSKVLFYLSIYNITSPVIALLSPIIMLLIPFVILKIRRIPVTISLYKEEIKRIFGKHPVGSFFKNFNKVGMDKKFYLICSICFYIFQMYNNTMVCYRFYKNQKYIHELIKETKKYISNSVSSMRNYLNYSNKLVKYSKFNINVKKNINILNEYLNNINDIYSIKGKANVHKNFSQLGYILQQFHRYKYDENLNSAINFSFGFNGYIENIFEIKKLINKKKINFCTFDKDVSKFKNMYYPSLQDNPKVIKNNIVVNNNYIITGPNAAGKTTFIKTIMLNIIFSQQLSVGFYKKANIVPNRFLHCYLNIPDTSSRDSLFQAEARRCKVIMDCVQNNPDKKHFCLFDELYSGTNPDEASASAFAFIDYLSKNHNVNFVLTTHFISVCEHLDNHDNIVNLHMKTHIKNEKLLYKYKIDKGISTIKGGLEVLKQLNYPDKMISKANKFDSCG